MSGTIQGNDELVKTLVGLAVTDTFTLTDAHNVTTQFTSKPVYQVQASAPPLADKVGVYTLDGFVDLITNKLDKVENAEGSYFVHVGSEKSVCLESLLTDGYGRRLTLIVAQPVPFDSFKFGQWMDQEEFVIAVASKFADSPDKQYVLDLAGSATAEAITTHNDNGFAQNMTAKKGMRMKEMVTLKPRISLAPFRTFPEVEQPVSEFIFRARTSEDEPPKFLLVEADGGRWKVAAINEIARYLRAAGLSIPVIS